MKISLASGVTITTIEGSEVVFSTRTGESFGLNETAGKMLRLSLDKDVEAAITSLALEYQVGEEELRDDVRELVEQLVDAKLVQVG
jgi:hypothetical protein